MAIHFDTRAFLRTLAGVAQGQIQGQMQGQQDHEAYQLQQQQLDRQQQEDALRQRQVESDLETEAQRRRMQPYSVLAPFASRFTPAGMAGFATDLSAAAQPPTASALGAVPHGRPLRAPVAPQAPATDYPDWSRQVSPQITDTQPVANEVPGEAMTRANPVPIQPAAVTNPAPAPVAAPNPLAVHGPGGKTYEIEGVTDKDKADIRSRYKSFVGLSLKVPANSPAAMIIAQNQPRINLNPQTTAELSDSQKALETVEGALRGIGLNGPAAAKQDRDTIEQETDKLHGMKGPRLVQSLLGLRDQVKQAQDTYGKKNFGFRLSGFSKELDELDRLSQSEDPADQTKAAQLAQTIEGGITSNLTPPQMTARINSWLKLIGKYSPGDKNYDAKAHEAAVKLGIESELPSGGTGLAGAALEKAYQSSLHAMVGFAGLNPTAQRPLLQDLQRLARATGRDPKSIPTELQKVVTEKDRLAAQRTQQILDFAVDAEARARRTAEINEAKFQESQKKLTNGGQLTAAQTLGGFFRKWKAATDAKNKFLKDNYATESDISAGDMLDPAQKKKAQQLQAAEASAQHDYNAFFSKAQGHGAPTSTTTTTTTRGAISGESAARKAARMKMKKARPEWKDEFITGLLDEGKIH
jgi:hypothetical protein